ncbi:MAG: hypothetical protein M3457_20870 [Chloroflexota bacterium]|nr:hypothetical protein [Chloroflexota bacterium]
MHSKFVVCFLFLFGFGVNGLPASSTAQPAATIPVLNRAIASTSAPGMVEVRGDRFSPGGLVYVVLYDQWGSTLHETRWVASSPTVYGANGSQDPAQGFVQGGRIEEAFAASRQPVYGPNGSQDPAQGFVAGDDGSQAPTAARETVYGVNGSQDPAQGYVAGDDGDRSFATACDAPLMVRAFDQRTASRSNLLDVEAACGAGN